MIRVADASADLRETRAMTGVHHPSLIQSVLELAGEPGQAH